MNKQLIGYFYGVLSTLIWSVNYLVPKAVNGNISPIAFNTARWLVAFLILLPFSLKFFTKENFIILKRDFWFYTIAGITGISIQNTLIYLAGQTSPTINLSLISMTSGVFMVIIAIIFFKRKLHYKEFFGILITVFGVLLLISEASLSNIMNLNFKIGDLYMLLGAISFAVYSTFVRKKPEGVSNHFMLFFLIFFGLIYMLPLTVWDVIHNSSKYNFKDEVLFSIFYTGIFASLIGYYLWNKAIDKIGIVKTAAIYYLIPVFSAFLAVIFFKERLYYYDVLSLVLIVFGVSFASSLDFAKVKKLRFVRQKKK